MKKAFSIMLVFLLLFIAGCVNDDDDKKADGDGSAIGVQASDYFPLTNGTQWNYTETGVKWDEPYTETSTSVVAGTIEKNGKIYSVVDEDGDSTIVRTEDSFVYWDNEFGGADEDEDAAEKIAVAKAAIVDAVSRADELVWFDFSKEPGSSWIMYEDSKAEDDRLMTVSYVGQRIGTEDITVPSGTFKNCAKFYLIKTGTLSYKNEESICEFIFKLKTTCWLAKNVGMVKVTETGLIEFTDTSTDDTDDENREDTEVSFESVRTLDSYSIAE